MKNVKLLVIVTCLSLALAGYFTLVTAETSAPGATIYACNCGADCKCKTVSTSPGNCACGSPLVAGHVIKVEGNEALVCQCGKDCQCKINEKDQTQCTCGKPAKRVNLAGTGLYFCNCKGSCFCNTVAGGPGKCGCGMNLKKAE